GQPLLDRGIRGARFLALSWRDRGHLNELAEFLTTVRHVARLIAMLVTGDHHFAGLTDPGRTVGLETEFDGRGQRRRSPDVPAQHGLAVHLVDILPAGA